MLLIQTRRFFRPRIYQLSALACRLKQSSLVTNLSWVAGAAVLSRVVGLVVLGYPARVLGPEQFGLVGFGASLTAYASILLSPGLLTWGSRAIARERDRAGEILVTVRLIQMILALVAYVGLILFGYFLLEQHNERITVFICGLVLFNSALSVDWVFNGLELMRFPAGVSIVTSVANVVGLLLFVRSSGDLYAYAFMAPVIGLIGNLLSYVLLLPRVRIVWPSWTALRSAFIASLPLGVTVALVLVLHYANNLIVKAYLGTSDLGVFLAAFRLLELASTIPGLLAVVFLSRLARLAVQNPTAARADARHFAGVLVLAGAFVASVMWAEAPSIISFFYGARFESAASLLKVMSVGAFFNFAIYGYTNTLISFGKDRVMLVVVVASTIVSVGGGLLFVPFQGLRAAAWVTSVIDLVGWLVSLRSYRLTVGSLNLHGWARPCCGGIAVVLSSLLMQNWHMPFLARLLLITIIYVPFATVELRTILQKAQTFPRSPENDA